MTTRNSQPNVNSATTSNFVANRTALLLVYPRNEPEGTQAAHDGNGPRFARALLTTEELLSLMA
ncbi:MAG TPA: hypothetical protein VGY58_13380 [Gemmataceae bacterium]|jgi:hypothetical protein|nr:hypothetical protein [Gemmataceae bacterium]